MLTLPPDLVLLLIELLKTTAVLGVIWAMAYAVVETSPNRRPRDDEDPPLW